MDKFTEAYQKIIKQSSIPTEKNSKKSLINERKYTTAEREQMNQQKIGKFIEEYQLVYNKETGMYDIPSTKYIYGTSVRDPKWLINGHLPVKLGVVEGDFSVYGMRQLTSLQNCPEEVHGKFMCSFNCNLRNLKGAPRRVEGDFECRSSRDLSSLEGAPEHVGGNFNIEYCENLYSLNGITKDIGGKIYTFRTPAGKEGPNYAGEGLNEKQAAFVQRQHLAYNPKTGRYDSTSRDWVQVWNKDLIDGHFPVPLGHITCLNAAGIYGVGLTSLTSLQNCPTKVDREFSIKDSQVTSLEGCPQDVGKFNCWGCNKLKNLIGAPKHVEGDFLCNFCYNLESLEGAPEYVGGDFDAGTDKKLKSLEGGPKYVGGDYVCNSSQIRNFKGIAQHVGGRVVAYLCNNIESFEGVGEVEGDFWCDKNNDENNKTGSYQYLDQTPLKGVKGNLTLKDTWK